MKKIIIGIILCLALIVSAKAQNDAGVRSYLTLSEAKEIANTYYGAFQQMAKHPVGEVRAQSELRIYDVIGKDNNGNSLANDFPVPNDLVKVVDNSLPGKETVTIGNYIGSFLRIAESNKMDFSYKILSDEYLSGPEMSKGNDMLPFVRIVVQKTIKTSDLPTMLINDTMFLHAKNKNVCSIKNQFGRSGFNYEEMTIGQLLVEAQNMYSNKHYNEAYRLYQKVLEKDPKNDDASYSLGVMSFKGEGCKHYPKKVRDYLVGFYWQKSEKGLEQLRSNLNELYVEMRPFTGRESNPFPSNRLFAYNFKTKKLGYISAQGKMVIKQQYQYGYPFFTNGTAIVMSDKNEWFLIDTMGKVKDVYLRVKAVEGGRQLLVHKEDKSGVINRKTGEWDIPLINRITGWDAIKGETKRYYVCKDGKYGIVSDENLAVVPVIFDNILPIVFNEDKKTFICNYDKSAYDQLLKKYEKSYKIPTDELKKIGTILEQPYPMCANGNTVMKLEKSDNTEWLLMDAEGRVSMMLDRGATLYNCTYIDFSKDGKDGVFDYTTGEWVVPLIYPHRSVEICAYCCNENDEIVFFSVNNESAYERLKKKYNGSSNIPDDELKKIGTLYKLPRNSK